MADAPVLVRLHAGNFAYFLDAQMDGSDLRFVASDDQTPLDFEIERFDGLAGVAAIWVKLPRLDPAEAQNYLWMYYGNDQAVAADNSEASWDLNYTAVYHFNETIGLPNDSTAFGHDATSSSARNGSSGLVDTALQFDSNSRCRFPSRRHSRSTPNAGTRSHSGFDPMARPTRRNC